jgi:hypothetical protein
MRVRRLIVVVGGSVAVAALWLMVSGSAVLYDPHHEVSSAELVDGWGKRQRLINLRFAHLGVPRLEGTVEIRCSTGKVIRSGYVTPGAPMWQRMGKQGDCSTR